MVELSQRILKIIHIRPIKMACASVGSRIAHSPGRIGVTIMGCQFMTFDMH